MGVFILVIYRVFINLRTVGNFVMEGGLGDIMAESGKPVFYLNPASIKRVCYYSERTEMCSD